MDTCQSNDFLMHMNKMFDRSLINKIQLFNEKI